MDSSLKFDYYYGAEAEQFSFYRVPRLLIKDERFKGLSSDAKLLYGLMLDRMSLSMKNGWFDDENRAYIHYTVENIMEDLGCARATCAKIIAELDSKKGIGLIEKKRQGLGKPDIIYVKNFVAVESDTKPKKTEKEPGNTDVSTEVQNLNVKKFNNETSRSSKSELQEIQKTEMLIVQDAVWNRVSQNRERKIATRYYCDEFHLLLKEKQTAIYSVEIWKRFRKWGGIPTGLTQNVGDFLKSEEIEGILGNSDFVYLLNQNAKDQSILADKLGLSDKQLTHVTNSETGSGLILFDNVVIPFVDKYPTDTKTYAIMNTKPEEAVKKDEAS